MDLLAWIFALLVALGGAYYVYDQQQQERLKIEKEKLKKKAAEAEAQTLYKQVSKKNKSKGKPKKVDITAELKKKQKADAIQEENEAHLDHPALRHVLKGHKFALTAVAYSPNGRFIVTGSTDRSIRVYLRETLDGKTPKCHQINLEYDHVTAMSFSSDGRTLVVATVNGYIKLYHKLKVKPELVGEFIANHKCDIHSVLMNDIGNWATIVTCAGDSDTDVKFWSLQGDLLQTINTNQVKNYHCVGSKDNRYIAIAAYTPEVKIFEITREKSGAFKKVNKIMSLHGHRTGVVDLAFDGSDQMPVNRVVTVSKDASVRSWDINVRYTLQEDPKVITSFTGTTSKAFEAVDFSPNGKLLAMARDHDLVFVRASDSQEVQVIENAVNGPIHRVIFDPRGSEVLAYSQHSKHARLFASPDGYH